MDVHDCKECGCCSSHDPMYSSDSPSRRGWPSGNPLFPPLLKLWDHTWETWGHDEPTLLGHQGSVLQFLCSPHCDSAGSALQRSSGSFRDFSAFFQLLMSVDWMDDYGIMAPWPWSLRFMAYRLGGDLMPPSCPIVNTDHSPRYGL